VKKQVIIVAGGLGERMNSPIPKQFIEIFGKPILMHTIQKFYDYLNTINIIVVLPKTQIEHWISLCKTHNFNIAHQIIKGGLKRFYSVKNGLSLAEENGLIAVHDAVRPLVSNDTINRVFTFAEKQGNAIAVEEIDDSIRQIKDENNFPVDRNSFRRIQTPQCFHFDILRKAYGRDFQDSFTDDATVVESLGTKIYLVQGNKENIKITHPVDLKIVEVLINFS